MDSFNKLVQRADFVGVKKLLKKLVEPVDIKVLVGFVLKFIYLLQKKKKFLYIDLFIVKLFERIENNSLELKMLCLAIKSG